LYYIFKGMIILLSISIDCGWGMRIDKEAISSHMLNLGLGALAHATHHAMYYSMENDRWPELSVLQAAHAAEVLIKARISQEHPLLIFEKLPTAVSNNEELDVDLLYAQARTIQYNALPDQLWATTGIRLKGRSMFDDFGKMRNSIQHFLPQGGRDYGSLVLNFIYEVIDPFVNECWGLYAVDYFEDMDGGPYLIEALVRGGIYFKVSEQIANDFQWAELEWPETNPAYKNEMTDRFTKALQANDGK